jgi:hypothetical protein
MTITCDTRMYTQCDNNVVVDVDSPASELYQHMTTHLGDLEILHHQYMRFCTRRKKYTDLRSVAKP